MPELDWDQAEQFWEKLREAKSRTKIHCMKTFNERKDKERKERRKEEMS